MFSLSLHKEKHNYINMKFKLSSTELASRLQVIGKVILAKNKVQYLDNFLFEVQGNMLNITASDGENMINTSLELIESSEDCRFVVNSTIQDALKGIPEQPITIEIDSSSYETKINYQNGFFSLVCQPINDNPFFTGLGEELGRLTVEATLLHESLTRALLAVAVENTRPVMCGVCVDISKENATIVASDGRKLIYTRWANADNATPTMFVLSQKTAQLLKVMLARESGDVVIRFNENRAEIKMNTYLMSCRLVDGKFPNYNSVIPNNQNSATVNRMALISVLRRVMVFSDEVNSLVKLHLDANNLTISVQNIDYSLSAEESMLCEYDGIPMNIGLRCTTLIDMLNNLQSEDVVLRLADQSRAAVIVPTPQPENQEIVMLTMPLMLVD